MDYKVHKVRVDILEPSIFIRFWLFVGDNLIPSFESAYKFDPLWVDLSLTRLKRIFSITRQLNF